MNRNLEIFDKLYKFESLSKWFIDNVGDLMGLSFQMVFIRKVSWGISEWHFISISLQMKTKNALNSIDFYANSWESKVLWYRGRPNWSLREHITIRNDIESISCSTLGILSGVNWFLWPRGRIFKIWFFLN